MDRCPVFGECGGGNHVEIATSPAAPCNDSFGVPIWSIGAGVAQRIFNPLVGGSNPSWITTGGLECPHRHLSNGPGVEVMGCAHGW